MMMKDKEEGIDLDGIVDLFTNDHLVEAEVAMKTEGRRDNLGEAEEMDREMTLRVPLCPLFRNPKNLWI